MKVARNVVVEILEDFGYANAGKWTDEKLQGKLQILPDKVEEGLGSERHPKVVNQIVSAVGDDEEVEITEPKAAAKKAASAKAPAKAPAKKAAKAEVEEEEDEDEEAEEEEEDEIEAEADEDEDEEEEESVPVKPIKTAKKGGAGKKVTKAAKEDKPKAAAKKIERDKFGAAKTSQCARINACFGLKPVSMAKILEKLGEETKSSSVRAHMQNLLKKELIEKTEKGYVLTQKA
jgi:uncharacterized protein involved in copper resistance